jgi:hypothetical protein
VPKVKGPLFSADAKGTLANIITFQGGFGGQRAQVKPGHRDAQSGAQLTQRAKFEEGRSFWHTLNEHEKEFYNFLANPMQMTGYDYCLAQVMIGERPW